MVDAVLLETLELLTPIQQKAILAVAQYLLNARGSESTSMELIKALLKELSTTQAQFATSHEGFSPSRLAARRFIRENSDLIHLLTQ